MTGVTEVNVDQREFWCGDGARRWAEHGERWKTMIAPFTAKAAEALKDVFTQYTSLHGVVTDATTWLVTANA